MRGIPNHQRSSSVMTEKLGRYELIEEIGRGGQSVAYRANDPLIGREVAVKQIRVGDGIPEHRREEFVKRFLQEAQVVGALNHPNIVSVFDMGETEDGPYIVMEFINGQNLFQIIAEKAPLRPEFVVRYFGQISQALDFAHQRGIVHRDIKPANLLLSEEGQGKILDFGVARLEDSDLTRTGALVGTPRYMSPEQIRGEKLDRRSDIFSLGICLYECLTGNPPFAGQKPTTVIFKIVNDEHPPVRQFGIDISGPFEEVVDRALAKRPEDRYATCTELADDLRRLMLQDFGSVTTFDAGLSLALASSEAGSDESDSDDSAVPETSEAGGGPDGKGRSDTTFIDVLRTKKIGIGAGIGVVLLLITAFWLVGPFSPEVPAANIEEAEMSLETDPAPAGQILREARAAFDAGNLVGDSEDDALHLAQTALALGDDTASELIDQTLERYRRETLEGSENVPPHEGLQTVEAYLKRFPEDPDVTQRRLELQNEILQLNTAFELQRLGEEARSALGSGNNDRAATLFERVVGLDRNNAEAHRNLAQAYSRSKKWRKAEQHLQTAVRLRPRSTIYLKELSDVLEARSRYSEAAKFLRRAAQSESDAEKAEALSGRADQLASRGRLSSLPTLDSATRHKHLLGGCSGTLQLTALGLRFERDSGTDHNLNLTWDQVSEFEAKGDELSLIVDGKNFNFDGLPASELGRWATALAGDR